MENQKLFRKNTGTLWTELESATTIREFLVKNDTFIEQMDGIQMLKEMIASSGKNKATIAKAAGMSDVYLYQILSGKRTPSRKKLICICIGMQASLEQTQSLLRKCGLAELYPKSRRDAVVMFGLMHQNSLFEINDMLYEADEEALT